LFITTREAKYETKLAEYFPHGLTVPSWSNTGTLGIYSLLLDKGYGYSGKMEKVKKQLIAVADDFVADTDRNAFGTVIGRSREDFVWGSNSVAANQGILLLYAFYLTGKREYLNVALTNADYLLGRNATGYCFITGFGSKQVMHPHHRPSEADGIVPPVPGLLSGGPNPGMQDNCNYPETEPETAFVDDVCSYASNEIAINWNAPAVFLFNVLDMLLGENQ
jgi:endoglucanase